jgi:tetratricopeptide (TPR) repeat protein
MTYEHDVFISYSSKDKEWVRGELLSRIEAAGLRAFIDFRDFTRGAPSIKEMERGVVSSRKTLLVLTPNYVGSEWGDLENIMVQTLDPANRGLRMLPLLRKECETPLRIGALTHVDFTETADESLAWRQLLTALGAPPAPDEVAQPTRDEWYLAHPYAMSASFAGRAAERAMLTAWLSSDRAHPVLVLRALGGFGKSALGWHWLLHDVDPRSWPRVVWWSFYEADATFENFMAETLLYLGVDPDRMPLRHQLNALIKLLRQPGTLTILDGFERALRAFAGMTAAYAGEDAPFAGAGERDCVSQLAEAFLRKTATLPDTAGKVLITTRLTPSILETRAGLLQGCIEWELVRLDPADAVTLFRSLGIRGSRAEIEAACEPYGYHPLSLGLLAGLIVRDIRQPGDIAAAKHLDVSGSLVQRQHHVLEQAYNSLSPGRRLLLSRIACFRSPRTYADIAALIDAPETVDDDLQDLVARSLLQRDFRTNRFDLHPIVRRYAYDRLSASDQAEAHGRLRDYFAAIPPPREVRTLDDLSGLIELYHHTVRAGRFDEACTLFAERLAEMLYHRFAAYQLRINLLQALFPDGEDHPPRLKSSGWQAWAINALANSYSMNGEPHRAIARYETAIEVYENLEVDDSVAIELVNLSDDLLKIGSLRSAESALRRSMSLHHEESSRELGHVAAYRGDMAASAASFDKAIARAENARHQIMVWAYRGLYQLLFIRLQRHADGRVDSRAAIEPAETALRLAEERTKVAYANPSDYVRCYWLIGAAYRVAGDVATAETNLQEALERCRRVNQVDHEANILVEIARLHLDMGDLENAQRTAEEALTITTRCGYVLQGADANLVLANIAKDPETKEHHAREALRLATCDGPPDYTYKAAYLEASALLGIL